MKQYKMEVSKQKCFLYFEEPKKQRTRKQTTYSHPRAFFATKTLEFQNYNVNVIKKSNKHKLLVIISSNGKAKIGNHQLNMKHKFELRMKGLLEP